MIGAIKAVITPDITIARLLIAPVNLPISIALIVPAECAEVPIAIPHDIGLCQPIFLHNISLTDAPKIPVMITADVVSPVFPPSSCVIPIAIAVVVEIAANDFAIMSPSPNIILITMTENTDAKEPTKIASIIGAAYFFNTSRFLYIGTAKQTVTGVRK